MGRLSPQEKGIFRNRVIQLERRLWNGVYKITWQNLNSSLRSWINMCDETVLVITKEVLDYKNLNKAISSVLKAIESHTIVFEEMNEGKVENFLSKARDKVNKHVSHVLLKAKSLGNYVTKIESFLEVRDQGVTPSVWDDYVQCIEQNLATAYEQSLTKSLRSLIELIASFRSKPMFKLEVLLLSAGHHRSEGGGGGGIKVSEDFDEICEFFLELPNELAEKSNICLQKGSAPVTLFSPNGNSFLELQGINVAMRKMIEKAKQDVQSYFQTLSPLQDFISLSPKKVLEHYHRSDSFIQCCERDVHKLREVKAFLNQIQRKVWINIFVLEMGPFIEENTSLLEEWEDEFLESIAVSAKLKLEEVKDLMDATRKSLKSQEEMTNTTTTTTVDGNIQRVEKRVAEVKAIADILDRTCDGGMRGRQQQQQQHSVDQETLVRVAKEFKSLKVEKEKAVDYFARKRVEDIKQLEKNVQSFEAAFKDVSENFLNHGPFTLSWKSQEALLELGSTQSRIRGLKEKESVILQEASELELYREQSSDLCQFEDRVNNVYQIWTVAGEWENFQQNYLSKLVQDADMEQIKGRLSDLDLKVSGLAQQQQHQQAGGSFEDLEVFNTLSSNVKSYHDVIELIIDKLSNDSLRPRHWEKISLLCGLFETESLLKNKTFDEAAAIFLDKDHKAITDIVQGALGEHDIEQKLASINVTLSKLTPRYDLTPLGVAVIPNSSELISKLKESVEQLHSLKNNSNSAGPFMAELTLLENQVFVAYERIEFFAKVEAGLSSASEIFALYGLDVQLGKLRQFLRELCSSWHDIYAALSERNNVLESLSDDLNKDIIAVNRSLQIIHTDLLHFLRTRMASVFPRLNLFLLFQTDHSSSAAAALSKALTAPHIHKMFPHVKKIHFVTRAGVTEAVSFTNLQGHDKKLAHALRVSDVPVDHFLKSFLDQSRQAFKSEINEAINHYRHPKQDKLPALSLHAQFVGRMTVFWGRLQAAISPGDYKEFQRWLVKTYDSQKAKIAALQNQFGTLKSGSNNADDASKEQIAANRNSLGVELYILEKVIKFLQLILKKATMKELQFQWYSLLKYVLSKETGEISVVIEDAALPFGYDETPAFDMVHYHKHIDRNVNQLARSLAQNQGTILKGSQGEEECCSSSNNKKESAQFLAMVLGRHLTLVDLHEHSKLDKLDLILAGLISSRDLIAIGLSSSRIGRASRHAFFRQISKLSSRDQAFSADNQDNKQSLVSRIMILDNGDTDLGLRFRTVQSAEPNSKAVMARILEGFGMSPNLRMVQSMFIISKLNTNSFSDSSYSGDWAAKNMYRKANLLQEVRDTFFEGDLALRNLFSTSNPFLRAVGQDCFNDIVSDIFQQPIDRRYFDPGLKRICDEKRLTVNNAFKKQLEYLKYALSIGDFVLIQGPHLSGKTSLWETVAEALHYEVYRLSSVILTDRSGCQRFEQFLNKLSSGREKKGSRRDDVLIVLDGPFVPEIISVVVLAIKSHCLLMSTGNIMALDRNVKLIVEDKGCSSLLTTKIPRHFALIRCKETNLPLEALLESRFHQIITKGRSAETHLDHELLEDSSSSSLLENVKSHVFIFESCRDRLGKSDSLETQFLNMNNFLLLLKASNCIHDSTCSDEEQQNDILLFCSLFCYSQDLSQDQMKSLEWKIRHKLNCRNVPIEKSMYEYYYSSHDRAWKLYSEFRRPDSKVLPKHSKALKMIDFLESGLISVDIFGGDGVGKTTLLKALASSYEGQEDQGHGSFSSFPIKCTAKTEANQLIYAISRSLEKKGGEKAAVAARTQTTTLTSSLHPTKGNLRILFDDVQDCTDNFQSGLNFLSSHPCLWLLKDGPTTLERTALIMMRRRQQQQQQLEGGSSNSSSSSSSYYTNGTNFVLFLNDLDDQDVTMTFKHALGDFFIPFEVELHFHIKKLIHASVELNKLTVGSQRIFPLQDNLKIINGLLRAHKDCQDTEIDLTNLWIHEVLRTYSDKLLLGETAQQQAFHALAVYVMTDIIGRGALASWVERRDILYGDFVNVHGFYSPLKPDQVRAYIRDTLKRYKAASSSKPMKLVLTGTTVDLFCKLQRILTHQRSAAAAAAGHLVVKTQSLLSPLSLVKLVSFNVRSELVILSPTDFESNNWKNLFRQVIRITGLEKKKCVLYIGATQDRLINQNCISSLESLVNFGMDLLLFERPELQVILESEGGMSAVATEVLKNFHCIMEDTTLLTDSPGLMKFFDVTVPICYDQARLDLSKEVMRQDSKVDPNLFVQFDREACAMFGVGAHDTLTTTKQLYSFLKFFETHCEDCKVFLDDITVQAQQLIDKILETIREAEDRVSSLAVMKEKNKELVAEQGSLHKENGKVKQEAEDLVALIDQQHVKAMNEDKTTINRAKLMVGQEMASNYALYQGLMDDLRDTIEHEPSMVVYYKIMAVRQEEEPVVVSYVKLLFEIFERDFNECRDKISSLHSEMVTLSEAKINEISEKTELQHLRKDVSQDIRAKCLIIDLLIDAHRRIESLAKVIKMKNSKYTRIEALSKNVAKESEIIMTHRRERQKRDKLLAANLVKIQELQKDISQRSEKINNLEQFASDFKNSQKELNSLLGVLKRIKALLEVAGSQLPGSLLLMSAYFSYTGHLCTEERKILLAKWKDTLTRSGSIQFDPDFLKVPILNSMQFRVAKTHEDIPRIHENMSMIQFLPNPLLVVDPLSVSIEYLFKPSKTGVIYCGDPDFKDQLDLFSAKFQAVIIRHFAFDLTVYQNTLEQVLKGTGSSSSNNTRIYHVVTDVSKEDWAQTGSKLHTLRFDLNGLNLKAYIFSHLKKLIFPPDPMTEEEKTERLKSRYEKIQKELDNFLGNQHSLSDITQVRNAIEKLKKLSYCSTTSEGNRDELQQQQHHQPLQQKQQHHLLQQQQKQQQQQQQQQPSQPVAAAAAAAVKSLETAAEVFSQYLAVLVRCPLKHIKVVVPLKKFLPVFQGIYEHLLQNQVRMRKKERRYSSVVTSLSMSLF